MEKIAVYGSGTIGSCQATLIIGHGIPCVVIGYSEAGLERCRNAILQNWDDLIAEGLATEANKEAAMKLVTITNDPAALEGCTFVFEAVSEDNDKKKTKKFFNHFLCSSSAKLFQFYLRTLYLFYYKILSFLCQRLSLSSLFPYVKML